MLKNIYEKMLKNIYEKIRIEPHIFVTFANYTLFIRNESDHTIYVTIAIEGPPEPPKEPPKEPPIKYPCVMIAEGFPRTIVLFTEKSTGVVLSCEDNSEDIGEKSDNWFMPDFKPYTV